MRKPQPTSPIDPGPGGSSGHGILGSNRRKKRPVLFILLLPSAIYALGSVAIWLRGRRAQRRLWLAATSVALLAWTSVLLIRRRIPLTAPLALWKPKALFPAAMQLSLDVADWQVLLALSALVLAVILTAGARRASTPLADWAAILAFSAITSFAVQAGNLLTVVIAWTIMDGFSFVYLHLVAGRGVDSSHAVAGLAWQGASALLVVGSAVADWSVSQAEGAPLARTPVSFGLLLLAVLLRLGILPRHSFRPALSGIDEGLAAVFRLTPAAAAIAVLGRSVSGEIGGQTLDWLIAVGVVATVVGCLRSALASDQNWDVADFILPCFGVGALAASADPAQTGTILGFSAVLILLSGGLLSLGTPRSTNHRILLVIGASLTAGFPWSPAGRIGHALVESFAAGGPPWAGVLGALGLAVLSWRLLRTAAQPAGGKPGGERFAQAAHTGGVLLLILLGPLVAGIAWPPTSPQALLLFAVSFSIAAGLALGLRGSAEHRPVVWGRRLGRLDLRTLVRTLDLLRAKGEGVLRVIGRTLEGEAAMLWILVVLLFVFLALGFPG